jgi:hypothetical protein
VTIASAARRWSSVLGVAHLGRQSFDEVGEPVFAAVILDLSECRFRRAVLAPQRRVAWIGIDGRCEATRGGYAGFVHFVQLAGFTQDLDRLLNGWEVETHDRS